MNKKYIVSDSKEIESIIKKGKKNVNKYFVIYNIERKDKNHNRYCISVSKKIGKAHTRNKIKRRIKDILMKNSISFNKDYVIIIRQGVLDLKYQEIKNILVDFIKEIK